MPENERKTLYIFIDESGNFDFSLNGTRYFVLTAVSTFTPLKSREELIQGVYKLKYRKWCQGESDYCFHATEDIQSIRDWVFERIKKLDDIEIDTILAQKNKTNPSLYLPYKLVRPRKKSDSRIIFKRVRSEEKFYDKISQILLKYIFSRCEDKNHIERIVVILGSLFTKRKREYILKSLKKHLKENFEKQSFVYFQSTSSDINCQIADYCGWAVYVRAERNEMRPWNEIKDKVQSHFDVFARGTTEYY